MLNTLSGLGDLRELQQRAQLMQQELQKEKVVIEKNGVKVVVRGDQVLSEIEVDGVIENRITEAINEAIKKTQELAARKLMEISRQNR